jgi:hypothetical protein
LLITPTLEHLIDGLGLRMQYRNRTDHIHATALIDGQNSLQPVSSNESLNQPMNHYHIAAGRRVTFDTIRPGVSPPGREGALRPTARGPQTPNSTTVFVTKAGWLPTAGDAVSLIHLMKTEQFHMDIRGYPSVCEFCDRVASMRDRRTAAEAFASNKSPPRQSAPPASA